MKKLIMSQSLSKAGKDTSLNINIAITKTLFCGIGKQIVILDEEIEYVTEFVTSDNDCVCMGSLITSVNECTRDIIRKIDKAKGVLAGSNTIWFEDHTVSDQTQDTENLRTQHGLRCL